MKLYEKLAHLVNALDNCAKRNPPNAELANTHADTIEQLVKDMMPSGSGIDAGTKLDLDASTGSKVVFTFGFHHMTDGGYYDGWTEHKAIVTPCLMFGFNLKITGRDRNMIKDYLHETYHYALTREVPQPTPQP